MKPLDDMEVQDLLHRWIFESEQVYGKTMRGTTALTTARAVLTVLLTAMIQASVVNDEQQSRDEPRC